MKKKFHELMFKLVMLFHRKKIVYFYDKSKPPANFIKSVLWDGKEYIQVAHTNLQNSAGSVPSYYVKKHEVRGIRFLPSKADEFCYKIGLKDRPNKITIKRLK